MQARPLADSPLTRTQACMQLPGGSTCSTRLLQDLQGLHRGAQHTSLKRPLSSSVSLYTGSLSPRTITSKGILRSLPASSM